MPKFKKQQKTAKIGVFRRHRTTEQNDRDEISQLDVYRGSAKRDGQTDKQPKNSTFLATPAAGEIRAPPNVAE